MARYMNDTKENIKIRTGNMKNCIWKTIHPGEVMEVPWHIGEPAGLKKMPSNTPVGYLKPKVPAISCKEEKKEEPQEKHSKGAGKALDKLRKPRGQNDKLVKWRDDLIAIKGVGAKSAKDIIDMFKSEKALIKAIKAGKEVHNNSLIDKLVKKHYS